MRIDGLEGNGSIETGLTGGEWSSMHSDVEFTVEVDYTPGQVGLVVASEYPNGERRCGNLANLSPGQAMRLADELHSLAEAAEDAA